MCGRSLLAGLIALSLITVPALAQTKDAGVVPRTPAGRPDLQGVWDFRSATPLERPDELAGKEFLTPEEAAAFEQERRFTLDMDRRDGGVRDVDRAYNDFWWDFGTSLTEDQRTSLIVDPPNGKIPPLTPEAERRAEMAHGTHPVRTRVGGIGADGPEDRGLAERCLLGFNAGPPFAPSAYNNNVQLFQTPDHVVILMEMVHDARIVSLDGRPPLPNHLRQWRGDSRGRWEGDTLVVETTNFTHKTGSFGPSGVRVPVSSETMHLTERFTRVDVDTLLYEFTVDDPATFTDPFTAVVPMTNRGEQMYEYACHEGNYGLANLLRGARAEEQTAAETPSRE
jgi:hypothetical protein